MVPTTHLQRHASRLDRAFSICCLHRVLRCTHITNTVKRAALHIVNLATSEQYEGALMFLFTVVEVCKTYHQATYKVENLSKTLNKKNRPKITNFLYKTRTNFIYKAILLNSQSVKY